MTRITIPRDLFEVGINSHSCVVRELYVYYAYDGTLAGQYELFAGQRVLTIAVDLHADFKRDVVVPVSLRRSLAIHNNQITLREAMRWPESGWYTLEAQGDEPFKLSELRLDAIPDDWLMTRGFRVCDFNVHTYYKRRPHERAKIKR